MATCQALRARRTRRRADLQKSLRRRLRRDIVRGALGHTDTLARARRDDVDESLLARCRGAAEQRMKLALEHRDLLSGILASEAGALQGLVVKRHDLWPLAQLSIHLSHGLDDLLTADATGHARAARELGAGLRRRLRKAQLAYARTSLETRPDQGRWFEPARQAALAEIGRRGISQATRLAEIEAATNASLTVLRLGVYRLLAALCLDWQGPEGPAVRT